MRAPITSALAAAAIFLGLSGAAMAQQQGGQAMQGMDHSRMQGMDHSNMPGMDHSNMQGSTQPRGNQGARAPAQGTQARPKSPTQQRSN